MNVKPACETTYLYRLDFLDNPKFYIGITKNLDRRFRQHKNFSKRGRKSPLYDAIRKYKNFTITTIAQYESRELAIEAERIAIEFFKGKIYNLAKGGDGGFVVVNIEEWKAKLRETRKGLKPSLGMKHTDENKELFRKMSREYWDNTFTYDAEEVLKYSHKEAKRLFGISTTHYYRLKNRAKDLKENK